MITGLIPIVGVPIPMLSYGGSAVISLCAAMGFVLNARRQRDIKLALQLARKALDKDPNYVNYDYRKEQLWGEKLQSSTQILLQNEQLQKNVIMAKSKINASS